MIVLSTSRAVDINFVLAGNVRSGASAIQSSLSQTPGVICHGDLLYHNGDDEKSDVVRRAAHESYFGPCADPKRLPEWCKIGEGNPCRYLNEQIFDNPSGGEKVVGVRLDYETINNYDLYELINDRERDGDFCMLHLIRNPVACYVSKVQAERSKVWSMSVNDSPQLASPPPIRIDVEELLTFCRQHEQRRRRLSEACRDALTINYYEVVYDFPAVMRKVLRFLERPGVAPAPACRRLRNHDFPKRVLNFLDLRITAPKEVRDLLNAPDCV